MRTNKNKLILVDRNYLKFPSLITDDFDRPKSITNPFKETEEVNVKI